MRWEIPSSILLVSVAVVVVLVDGGACCCCCCCSGGGWILKSVVSVHSDKSSAAQCCGSCTDECGCVVVVEVDVCRHFSNSTG